MGGPLHCCPRASSSRWCERPPTTAWVWTCLALSPNRNPGPGGQDWNPSLLAPPRLPAPNFTPQVWHRRAHTAGWAQVLPLHSWVALERPAPHCGPHCPHLYKEGLVTENHRGPSESAPRVSSPTNRSLCYCCETEGGLGKDEGESSLPLRPPPLPRQPRQPQAGTDSFPLLPWHCPLPPGHPLASPSPHTSPHCLPAPGSLLLQALTVPSPPPSAPLISSPGSPSPQLGTASFGPISACQAWASPTLLA